MPKHSTTPEDRTFPLSQDIAPIHYHWEGPKNFRVRPEDIHGSYGRIGADGDSTQLKSGSHIGATSSAYPDTLAGQSTRGVQDPRARGADRHKVAAEHHALAALHHALAATYRDECQFELASDESKTAYYYASLAFQDGDQIVAPQLDKWADIGPSSNNRSEEPMSFLGRQSHLRQFD